MAGAWGPIEFTGSEIAVILVIFGLVPPFFIAVVGSLVHAVILLRRGDVTILPLFLRWWMWSTAGWVGAWFLAILFS